jgi:predicted NBD/HSP70 family sugar kinase
MTIELDGLPCTCGNRGCIETFVGGWAIQQLWLFWVAPLVGATIAGVLYPALLGDSKAEAN